jgi:hypothetical protein
MPPAGRRVGVLNVEPVFVEALGERLAAAGVTFARLSETLAVHELVGGSARAGLPTR